MIGVKYRVLRLLAGSIFPVLFRLWSLSLRWEDRTGPAEPGRVVAFWHEDIFAVIGYLVTRRSREPMTAMVSASPDGDVLAALLRRLQFKVVRGSSSSGGGVAYRGTIEALERGESILITPDGPRGPRRVLKRGVLRLARRSGSSVTALRVVYAACWTLATWDRFRIPKPFSRVRIEGELKTFSHGSEGTLDAWLESELDGHRTSGTMAQRVE